MNVSRVAAPTVSFEPMIGRPSGVSPNRRSSCTWPIRSRGVSRYMLISSQITPFSRSISSASNREESSMSESTSIATGAEAAAHLT